ncbi:MAG: hypothetical protein LBD68_04570 [Zoogloeaceae bacterium]|jgi:hypothetical protein|nr:hypothetical protein [Zoogloeaceae bacterium]
MPEIDAFLARVTLGGYAEAANTTTDFYGRAFFAQPEPAAFLAASALVGTRSPDFPAASAGREIGGFTARTYFEDYYNRIHVSPSFVDVGNLAAEQQIAFSVWNAFFRPATLAAVTGLDDGATIDIGRRLPLELAPLQEITPLLSIAPTGPSEIDMTPHFVFTGDAEVLARIVGNRVIAFSWPVNWSASVTERFSWLTDVLMSESGSEQRRALRRYPRAFLSGEILATKEERAALDLALSAWAARVWAVPFWPDAQRTTEAIPAGSFFIACRTAGFDFHAGSLALLIGDSALDCEAAEILDIDASGLHLKRATRSDWRAFTRLYPARMGILAGYPEITRHSDETDALFVEFQLTEPRKREGRLPTAIHAGLPVFSSRPDETEKLSRSQERITHTLDNETGVLAVTDSGGRAFQRMTHRFLCANREETERLIDFLHGLCGRQKAVWVPTHAADLTPSGTLHDIVLPVKRTGYVRFGLGAPGRRDILITLIDGSTLMRRITGGVETGEGETLTLDLALPRPIPPEEVARVSFIVAARLASDDVEIEHICDNDGAARAEVIWRAVDQRTED